jgi:hypothetical protein
VVTSATNDIAHWPVAFRAAGEEHYARAETAPTKWRSATADEAFANAALWLHFGTCVGADRAAFAELLNQAAVAHRRARWRWSCRHRPSNTSVRIELVRFFAAILERPNPQSSGDTTPTPVAIVAPGPDSRKEEFARVAASLRRRGLATTRIDGPGQGDRVAATGLSLGRYYVPRAAAFEPRIKATVTVTGPCAFGEWDNLPPMIQEIVVLRTAMRRRHSNLHPASTLPQSGIAFSTLVSLWQAGGSGGIGGRCATPCRRSAACTVARNRRGGFISAPIADGNGRRAPEICWRTRCGKLELVSYNKSGCRDTGTCRRPFPSPKRAHSINTSLSLDELVPLTPTRGDLACRSRSSADPLRYLLRACIVCDRQCPAAPQDRTR